jgi:hypothetical protein
LVRQPGKARARASWSRSTVGVGDEQILEPLEVPAKLAGGLAEPLGGADERAPQETDRAHRETVVEGGRDRL